MHNKKNVFFTIFVINLNFVILIIYVQTNVLQQRHLSTKTQNSLSNTTNKIWEQTSYPNTNIIISTFKTFKNIVSKKNRKWPKK